MKRIARLAMSLALAGMGASCDEPRGAVRPARGAGATVRPAASVAPSEATDNFFCLVCHANMKSEELAATHAAKGVGCASCHGESHEHSADENGITPPEIMFARSAINAACIACHPADGLAVTPVHVPVLERTATDHPYCTSCHGEHSLAHRTRRWDKVTRKLIEDDGVRMVDDGAAQK